LSNHILSTTLFYGFHVTVIDYTSFDMHDDVATMPRINYGLYSRCVSYTSSYDIHDTKSS